MITVDQVKRLLHYEPDTGVFTWLVQRSQFPAGKVAGRKDLVGYIQIKINYKNYLSHRLAWFYMTGEWPEHEVDHRNNDRADNRWANLRAATRSQNQGNRLRSRNNTSGFKGVLWDKQSGRWKARIRQRDLGYYANIEDAAAAYEKAAKELFGEFARSA